jgi:sugar lactone lactonase YvrE
MMRPSSALGFTLVAVASWSFAGCGDDGKTTPDALGGTDAAAVSHDAAAGCDPMPAACPTTGMGTLAITVEGLPADVTPMITVSGPAGAVSFAPSSMVGGGSYVVAALRVTAPDPLVRRAFTPVVMTSPTCVMNGMTATVKVIYSEIATSNKLWLGNANAMAELLGYSSSAVRMTGMAAATVAARVKGADNLAFDRDGNLWAGGNTVGDPPILRIPAAMLGTSGTKTADINIESAEFGGGSPRSTALAFDKDGNLWSTVGWKNEVVRFAAAQITASGNPMPAIILGGLKAPRGLAFDKDGNLWMGNSGEAQVVRFNASRLTASTTMPPDLIIVANSPPPVVGPRTNPQSLAFDKSGNLWVSFEGGLMQLPAADLAGSGMKTLTPTIQIAVSVTALPEGIALDEGGGLWFAGSVGTFVRLAPDQLTTGGDKIPSTVITSADVGSAGDLALFPAPAGLPLFHSWP